MLFTMQQQLQHQMFKNLLTVRNGCSMKYSSSTGMLSRWCISSRCTVPALNVAPESSSQLPLFVASQRQHRHYHSIDATTLHINGPYNYRMLNHQNEGMIDLSSTAFHNVTNTLNRMKIAITQQLSYAAAPVKISSFESEVITQKHQSKTGRSLISILLPHLEDLINTTILHLKRTFQPSIIRKKRKTGFLVRQRTVGGRKTLARRRAKGRHRLGGGI